MGKKLLLLVLFIISGFQNSHSLLFGAENAPLPEAVEQWIVPAEKILILGDSITYSGKYVVDWETWLNTQPLAKRPFIVSCGLPSETVSCLSEQGHAGGKFPRPCLHERLDRVLEYIKPDLVFACYGMNCGIYKPLSKERFENYKTGIRTLKQKVEATGAKLILLTPPFYDEMTATSDVPYETVLKTYSQWLVSQRANGWNVIDLHSLMVREIEQKRKTDPDFTVQKDAVHPNAEGHWMMARAMIQWFDPQASLSDDHAQWLETTGQVEQIKLIQKRMGLLKLSYLTATKHIRPGIPDGIPVTEAHQQAGLLTEQIEQLSEKH